MMVLTRKLRRGKRRIVIGRTRLDLVEIRGQKAKIRLSGYSHRNKRRHHWIPIQGWLTLNTCVAVKVNRIGECTVDFHIVAPRNVLVRRGELVAQLTRLNKS